MEFFLYYIVLGYNIYSIILGYNIFFLYNYNIISKILQVMSYKLLKKTLILQ